MDQPPENLSDRVFARLRPSTARQLDAAAAEEKREKSEVVRIAIEEYLERREKLNTILRPARDLIARS